MFFSELKAEEVGARVNYVRENGLSLVLFIDARTVMDKLDEAVGPMNWKREHRTVGDSIYCKISIRNNETGEWISKEDVGSASPASAEKGESSDSFKRAGVCWGIGRELYSSPFIWIKKGDYQTQNDTFKVTAFECTNGVITYLRIKNMKTGKEVFRYGSKAPGTDAGGKTGTPAEKPILEQARELMRRENIKEADVTRACEERCGDRFGIKPGMKLSDYPADFVKKVVLGNWAGIKKYLTEQATAACQTA